MRLPFAASFPALTQRLQRRLPELSVAAGWIAALALTAWLAAGWFWRLTAPEPVALVTRALTDPAAAARSIAQRHLFGGSATAGTPAAVVRAYTLVGAMTASRNQPGFAVIGEAGKPPTAVFEGENIGPGVKLEQVLANKAIIVRDGQRETIDLTAGAPAAGSAPATPAMTAAPGADGGPAMRPVMPPQMRATAPQNPNLPEMHNP